MSLGMVVHGHAHEDQRAVAVAVMRYAITVCRRVQDEAQRADLLREPIDCIDELERELARFADE
jgi:hypothetical protein